MLPLDVLVFCTYARNDTHVITKDDSSAITLKLRGFQGLHCESASASSTYGQERIKQSDMQLASAQDNAALEQEGKTMKRSESGCLTHAPILKSREITGGPSRFVQNWALANTSRLIRVTCASAYLPAPQVLHCATDVAPGTDEALPTGHGVHTDADVAPITEE
jgi:hypothetical protein